MNIYRTKGETYINMDQVTVIETDSEEEKSFCVNISLVDQSQLTLYREEAKAFLDYLNRLGFYAGSA
jgi:hypothetical protein